LAATVLLTDTWGDYEDEHGGVDHFGDWIQSGDLHWVHAEGIREGLRVALARQSGSEADDLGDELESGE
jgi:hypothetical protein